MKHERDIYRPPYLHSVVASLKYKPGWGAFLEVEYAEDGAGGLHLFIVSSTEDSRNPGQRIRVRHGFLVPPASYNRDTWAAWLFDRICDVERHEAGEFFLLDGVREFGPHHGNGENPYLTWHVSDYAAQAKGAGDA